MSKHPFHKNLLVIVSLFSICTWGQAPYVSPTAVTVSKDSSSLYIAEYSSGNIAILDFASGEVNRIPMPAPPNGMALSPDGSLLYVTCYADTQPYGLVVLVDIAKNTVEQYIPAGHSPCSPVLNPNGSELYICNRFSHSISVMDLESGKTTASIKVQREPTAAAITPDGKVLAVANYLPIGRADLPVFDPNIIISAAVSLIDIAEREVMSHVPLSDGSVGAQNIAVSEDGKYAYVPHVLSRYPIAMTTIENGWINSNVISVIALEEQRLENVVVLDDFARGAANLWGMALANNTLFTTAAGSHDLFIIDETALREALHDVKGEDLSSDFMFVESFKQRMKLKIKGPRSVAAAGGKAYVAGYFSDAIAVFDSEADSVTESISLNTPAAKSDERLGEELFFDGSLAHQSWHSCHSCHPHARASGLNLDGMADGTNNPKNTPSLLWTYDTPPSLWTGVRDSADIAVKACIRYVMFSFPKESDAAALGAYLKQIQPIPSPFLVDGKLSESAQRGKALFVKKFQCNVCHPSPFYTDMKLHDIGTRSSFDRRSSFDTPTLAEVWRTAPYLHDGSYSSLEALFLEGRHGIIGNADTSEIIDLIAWINAIPHEKDLIISKNEPPIFPHSVSVGKDRSVPSESASLHSARDWTVTILEGSQIELLFELPRAQQVSADLLGVHGRGSASLIQKNIPKGRHAFRVNSMVPSGLYVLKVKIGDISKIQKIFLP